MLVIIGAKKTRRVSSWAEASQEVRREIERNNLDAPRLYRNAKFGLVLTENGEPVARVSPNGRVWPGTEYVAGSTSLYNPWEG
jgi:hypothetical protein